MDSRYKKYHSRYIMKLYCYGKNSKSFYPLLVTLLLTLLSIRKTKNWMTCYLNSLVWTTYIKALGITTCSAHSTRDLAIKSNSCEKMSLCQLTKVPKLCLVYFSINKSTCIVETKRLRNEETGEKSKIKFLIMATFFEFCLIFRDIHS